MRYLIFFLLVIFFTGCSDGNRGQISASGTIEAVEMNVGAKVGGQIEKLFVDEGYNVNEGDTLGLIDRSDLEIQYDQAKANADASEAQYKLVLRGARDEDINQAEATLKNAEDDLKRTEGLFKEGSISQKQLDDVRMRYILAKQSYDKLKSGSRPEEIDVARARRDQAVAQLRAIKKKLYDSFIVAPVSGVVTRKPVEEGEVVTQNANLFRISRLSKVYLMIYVSEVELAGIKIGQEANVFIDAEAGKPFTGSVTYISSIAEFTPKNVQTKEDRTKLVFGVKIEIPNQAQILKPGMPADAVIKTSQNSQE